MSKRDDALQALIAPLVESQGLSLWGITFLPQGQHSMLRIFVDAGKRAVDSNECASLHRQISAMLAVEDVIKGDYGMEVSTPGMDRQLFTSEQYQQYVGNEIKLRLKVAQEGQRKFRGELVRVADETIVVRVEQDEHEFALSVIDKANLVVKW